MKKTWCGLNDAWTDPERENLHRVIRFLGVLPQGETEAAAQAVRMGGNFSNQDYYILLVCIGVLRHNDTARDYPTVPQILWDDVLEFIFTRFADYHPQKTAHGQWDNTAGELWGLRDHYKRDKSGFINHIKENLEG